MDSTLQAQFQRLELALSTLVDSIASYNPSPQAAVDLVAADDELSRGLDQLATHQANHARILALRAEADALEAQFKSSVSVLAGLRRELFETPATTFPDSSRLVPFEELLQYAKNISEYTIPPSYRERIPEFDSKVAKDKEGEEEKEKDSNLSIAPVVEILKDTADGEPELEPPKEISAEEAGWLKDLQDRQYSWYPWPVNDKIRKGSLMQIQRLRDMGTDPAEVDSSKRTQDEKTVAAMHLEHPTGPQAAPEAQVTRETVFAPSAPPADEGDHVFTGFDFADDD